MKKKRVSFAPVLRPRSPTPRLSASSLTPVSLSSCPPQAPTSGHQPVPPLPASPPDQTNIPHLIIGPAPLLPARKASSLHRSSCPSFTPCPVNPHFLFPSPLRKWSPTLLVSVLSPPNPLPGPFLASGPLGPGFTDLSSLLTGHHFLPSPLLWALLPTSPGDMSQDSGFRHLLCAGSRLQWETATGNPAGTPRNPGSSLPPAVSTESSGMWVSST